MRGLTIREATDASDVTAVRKGLELLSGGRHPLLSGVNLYHFRGARVFVAEVKGVGPVALLAAYFGKRPQKGFGPYCNLYLNYTAPSHRRRGVTAALYERMMAEAKAAGCTRLKSLAGSRDGVLFQLSRGHQFWGRASGGELIVDVSIGNPVSLGVPPNATQPRAMNLREVLVAVRAGLPH